MQGALKVGLQRVVMEDLDRDCCETLWRGQPDSVAAACREERGEERCAK